MRSSLGWPIALGVSLLLKIVVDINMALISAILLHTLPTSAQCDYNASDAEGYRRPRQNP
jgi:hypothetical protein